MIHRNDAWQPLQGVRRWLNEHYLSVSPSSTKPDTWHVCVCPPDGPVILEQIEGLIQALMLAESLAVPVDPPPAVLDELMTRIETEQQERVAS